MGLLDKLRQLGSILSNLNGGVASPPDFRGSKLHYEYSINDNPNIADKPAPSNLDLDGQTPPTNYRDNSPEGKTF